MNELEIFDVNDELGVTSNSKNYARFMYAIVQLNGKILGTVNFKTSFNARIALPSGSKSEFERITGFTLTTPE